MGRRATVLFVDDSDLIRDAVARRWRDELVIHVAASAAEAREVLRREQIEFMVIDLYMIGEDGISLASWVRRHWPAIGTCIATCNPTYELAQEAVREGADMFTPKPFDLPQVCQRITELRAKKLAARPTLDENSLQYIRETVALCAGKKAVAAKVAGISRSTMRLQFRRATEPPDLKGDK